MPGGGNRHQELFAVRLVPIIFAPRHLAGIGSQEAPADVMMRPNLGTTQAGEEAFRPISAYAFVHEGDGVIDAADVVNAVQRVR